MLGRVRRTTRTDVGLGLAFAGLSYLVWAMVAGASRGLVQEMIKSTYRHMELPKFTYVVKVFFVDAGFVIDLVGLAWLAVSLALVLRSSRQRMSISWAWVSAACQSFVAAIGAVVVGWAAYAPHVLILNISGDGTPWEQVSGMSLPVIMVAAVVIWVMFLVWLLVERARFNRHGPTPRDGLRTNIFR